jgi:hypothetical protein
MKCDNNQSLANPLKDDGWLFFHSVVAVGIYLHVEASCHITVAKLQEKQIFKLNLVDK